GLASGCAGARPHGMLLALSRHRSLDRWHCTPPSGGHEGSRSAKQGSTRGCFGRRPSPVPHTRGGSPYGLAVWYGIWARRVTPERRLRRRRAHGRLPAMAHRSLLSAGLHALALPRLGRAGRPHLGPGRRPHAGGVYALLLAWP